MMALLLRNERGRVAEERLDLDLMLVGVDFAAGDVEMRDARALLRVALHLEDDRESSVILHQNRLVIDGIISAVVHAASVRRGLDHVENRFVRLVGKVIAQVLAVVVELVGVKRAVRLDRGRTVLAALGSALRRVFGTPVEKRTEA